MKNIVFAIAIFIMLVSSSVAQNGNLIFDDATIHEIRFDNVDTTTFFLFANKGIYSMCKITIDGTIIDSIGATTKGNISWYHPNNKKPLKIKLNEFVSGKKYDGIKKFYLHNNYQDPSLMRDKLTYDICELMDLHSLRTAFSKVYINNEYWGVYTLVEAKDELYKRDFKDKDAEVYETFDLGSPCVFSQEFFCWGVDNGNPDPTWPRLQLLTDKLANTPVSEYLDTIPSYINITDFFKYQAVNVYLLNLDSYLAYNGNQLYLFDSIVENRFQIIPWDFNASFGLWNTNNVNTQGIIPSLISNKCPFDKIHDIPQLKNTYLDAMCLLNNIYCDTLALSNKITYFYNQIKTAVYEDTRKMPTNSQFDLGVNYGYQFFESFNVPGLKTFVNERWLTIKTDLQSLPYTCAITEIEPDVKTTPLKQFSIEQNYPNPFNPTTTIRYSLPKSTLVTLKIFNLLGQEVQTLVSGYQESGNKSIEFNATDIPAGVYFYRLNAEGIYLTRKLILLK
ncbi:MAG: CotH kinase family protein [Ignavibacteriales bacterium]|nr:CotH kinase family protein [Ignavibacteriales bacterium]